MSATDKPMDQLLSEVLARYETGTFLRPVDVRTPERERVRYYRDVAKQLGPRYAECTLDNFDIYEEKATERPSQGAVLAEIRRFAADMPKRLGTGGGVVLFGPPGTGKDHLLTALMYEAILRYGWTVKWTSGVGLSMQARELIRTKGSEVKFIKEHQRTFILTISDPVPPKGDASQYAADLIQRIVDRRYRDLKPTWVTLNVEDGAEAAKRLAGPIVDRLRHDSLTLECAWPSYRKQHQLQATAATDAAGQ